MDQQHAAQRRERRRKPHLEGRRHIGAQQRDFAPAEAGLSSQRVERVVFGAPVAHRGQRLGDHRRAAHALQRRAVGVLHAKRLDESAHGCAGGVDTQLVASSEITVMPKFYSIGIRSESSSASPTSNIRSSLARCRPRRRPGPPTRR